MNMGYYINPTEMMGMFPVPCSVIDKHLKLADPNYIKILLWFLRNAAANFDVTAAATELKISEITVSEALLYWVDAGILCSTEAAPATASTTVKAAPKKAIKAEIKPDREECVKRGLECPEIKFILDETAMQFGRGLKESEISTLVWLYDNQGISPSLLLMIISYAVSEGRATIGFIERTAVEWVNDGVSDVVTAENRLVEMRRKNSSWHLVETAFGIEKRQPSAAELEAADKWVTEWGYDREILRAAYDSCVDATSKFSFPYIKKILAEWHKQGVKTVDDLKNLEDKKENKPQKQSSVKQNGDKYQDFVNSLIKSREEN
jgi:DnaD/phage-associated family protein